MTFRSRLVAAACVLAVGFGPGTALATVTYHYSGAVDPRNARSGGIVSYIDELAPITFDFTVASPLAANLAAVDIQSSLLAWTVSGGKAQSTVGSTDISTYFSRVRMTTDALGNITAWNIAGHAGIAALPSDQLEFYFNSLLPYHETLYWYLGAYRGRTIGGAVSVKDAGTFSKLVGAVGGAVPEPSTWALMIVGFGLAGAGLRRRRVLRG